MAKSSTGGTSSSSGRERKRKRERYPSSISPDSTDDATVKRAGSSQSGDSSKSVEVRPGSLMEALLESKEKNDSSRHSKKSKKKHKERDRTKESEKEERSEPVQTRPVLEPATVAGAARDELDLTLREEDLKENYDTDEEDEAEERRRRHESQLLRKVQRTTKEYDGEGRWNHEESLARFEEEVREDIRRKKEGQQSRPTLHTPTLHSTCKCARSSSTARQDSASSSSASEGEDSDDSDYAGKREQRDRRRKANIKKRNKQRKTKQSEAAMALVRQEVEWRRHHPCALSSEIVFNVPDMLNESPACRCSVERKSEGMRHNHYLGEKKLESNVQSCSISSLHHYVLTVSPSPSGQLKRKAEMRIQGEGWSSFHFDGFSLLSHRPLPPLLPQEPQHKWTDQYRIVLEEDEKLSEQTVGSIRALDSLFSYITEDILELFDLRRWPEEVERERRARWSRGERGSREEEERADGCPLFHVLPRFVRTMQDGSSELAPISAVLDHIRDTYARTFCSMEESGRIHCDARAFDAFADAEREGLVIDATRRPAALRVDAVERTEFLKRDKGGDGLPVITHKAWRPTAFILAARPDFQAASARFMEMKAELLAGTEPDKRGEGEGGEWRLQPWEEKQLRSRIASAEVHLQKLKNDIMNHREVAISLPSMHFRRTGFKSDLAQHSILLVMMMNHVRFHWALEKLEERIAYKFNDRTLIELALSHPSYNANYGTNPDHARNAINLCGVLHSWPKSRQHLDGPRLQPEILDIKKGRSKKKELDRMVEIMEGFPGAKNIQVNPGTINERLEFLGDSVVEMIVTVHLFFLLPSHDEGSLSTFRSALVQNKNLAALAQEIYLDKLMLMSHGVELLHEPEYRHATANSFEAFMAAVYLDSGKNMDHCERIYGDAMFGREPKMLKIWNQLKEHELQADFPGGDRHRIPQMVEGMQKLVQFEDNIGLKFEHIALLARAFTRNSHAVNNVTKGDHQSLELLGDTILQMATTEFLYKKFPLLHEGHLSLLRTCLVSNKTQSVICDDLDMTKYVVDLNTRRNQKNKTLKMKDKADLVESLLGAIYVDRGWEYCRAFTRVCFFPRMKFFIDSHAWADPKSALQQLCLALPRPASSIGKMMPDYKLVGEHGPTNSREYTIACIFRGKKISEASAKTMHGAQMMAAQLGMQNLPKFFPEDWAKHEQKLLRQRSLREPINKGGVAGAARREQAPPPTVSSVPASTSPHFPSHVYPHAPSSFSYPPPPFTPRLLPQYGGCPAPPVQFCTQQSPFFHYPPPPRPMGLMSIDLSAPPAMMQPLQSPPPAAVSPQVCTPDTATKSHKKTNRERKEDRKRKRMKSDRQDPTSPPPPFCTAAAPTHRPSTPLSTHTVYRGKRLAGGATDTVPPPYPEWAGLYPVPPPAHSEWVPMVPGALPHRNPHQRPTFAPSPPVNGPRPRSQNHYQQPPPPQHRGGSHRPIVNGQIVSPHQIVNQTPPPRPKSLMDLSFQDMWGHK